jgi:hypothetical protein
VDQIFHAKAVGVDQPIVLDDADSESRYLLLVHEVFDQRLQLTTVTFSWRLGGNTNAGH